MRQTSQPLRIRMNRAARHEQLLGVALRLFAQYGYTAVTMERIADEAGVSKPVVYDHFRDKESLYSILLSRELSAVESIAARAVAEQSAVYGLIEAISVAFVDYTEANPWGLRLLVRPAPVGFDADFSLAIGKILDRIADMLEPTYEAQAFDPGLARIHVAMMAGTMFGGALWWQRTRAVTKDAMAAQITNLVYRGIQEMQRKPQLSAEFLE